MKKTLYMLLAAALVLASCEDNREDNLEPDQIRFRSESRIQNESIFQDAVTVSIIKAGTGRDAADVRIGTSTSDLIQYNVQHGTDYLPLPSSFYRLSSDELHFSASDVRQVLELSWDPAILADLLSGGEEFVIPLKIEQASVPLTEGADFLLVRPFLSTLGMKRAVAQDYNPVGVEKGVVEQRGTVAIDNPIGKDLTIRLSLDGSGVTAFDKSRPEHFLPAQSGVVSLIDSELMLPAGESQVDFRYSIDLDRLFAEDGTPDFQAYAEGIRISSVSYAAIPLTEPEMIIPILRAEKAYMGPWEVLEGSELCIGREASYLGEFKYFTENMFDGNLSTAWWSLWATDNRFPMSFVVDMGQQHIIRRLKIKDAESWQGQYRDYEFYVAPAYTGVATPWVRIAAGTRGLEWKDGGNTYDFPVSTEAIGRYLKFVILRPSNPMNGEASEDGGEYAFLHGRGKLSEIWIEAL